MAPCFFSKTYSQEAFTVKNKKKGMSITGKQRAAGWMYLAPATILIFIMSFWPIIQAVITSFKTGSSANMQWANPLTYNYTRMFQDAVFKRSIGNTFLYLIIEVPIMLVLAILLAQLLNNKHLKFKGLFRTCVFLPCATSLVSYAVRMQSHILPFPRWCFPSIQMIRQYSTLFPHLSWNF